MMYTQHQNRLFKLNLFFLCQSQFYTHIDHPLFPPNVKETLLLCTYTQESVLALSLCSN